jgi:ribosomal protein S18 acetylase RimI-like enzyme
MNWMIRLASRKDVPQIAALHNRFLQDRSFIQKRVPSICECSTITIRVKDIEKSILQEMKDPAYTHVVAIDQEKVVGYLVLIEIEEMDDLLKPPYSSIDTIEIHPDYQNKGLGQVLMDEAIRIAKEKHHYYIDLNVWVFNDPAIHLYSKNGFIPIEQRMAKKLQ